MAGSRRHDGKIYHGDSFSSIAIEIERGDKMKKMGPSDLLRRLEKKRKEIDLLDQKLLTLLNQRLRTARKIGKIKREMGKRIYDFGREKEILDGLRRKNKGPLKSEDLRKIFTALMKACRKSQT
jgi:chorismate mutase